MPQKTVNLQALKDTRELLTDPGRWVRGHWALDASGGYCNTTSPDACQWCISGALEKIGWDEAMKADKDRYCLALDIKIAQRRELEKTINEGGMRHLDNLDYVYRYSIISINDDFGHAAVLELLDKTIARLEAEVETPQAT